MQQQNEYPGKGQLVFTDAECDAFAALHQCQLHPVVMVDSECNITSVTYIDRDTVKVTVDALTFERDCDKIDTLRARVLMVANTRMVEQAAGLGRTAMGSNQGTDFIADIKALISTVTGLEVNHYSPYSEYQPTSLVVHSRGLGWKERYVLNVRQLVKEPYIYIGRLIVEINKDFANWKQRTND